MKTKEKVLDDIARVAGGGMGILSGLRRQMKSDMRARIDEIAMRLDLVPREDFERLESLVMEMRRDQKAMQAILGEPSKKAAAKKTKAKTNKS